MGIPKDNYKKYEYACTTCGNISHIVVKLDEDKAPPATAKCKKCSNTAYVLTLGRMGMLIVAVNKEMVKLKSIIFDLECQIEQLVDPVDYGD